MSSKYISLKTKYTGVIIIKGKGKGSPYNRPRRPSGGIAILFFKLGVRWRWVVSSTPRPLYPQERPATFCIGG